METAGAWHIAMLEPRAMQFSLDEHDLWESKAARFATARGYECYYPGLPRRTHVRHRVPRTSMTPMFPGYMFVRRTLAHDWEALRNTPGVRTGRCLLINPATGSLAILSDEAFWAIVTTEEQLREAMLNPPPRKLPYAVGDRVVVTDGPFENLLGKVVSLDSEARIAILLELSGWRVHARADQLAPAREAKRAAS